MSVSPRNAMKIEEVDMANYINSECYMHYLMRLMLICTSLFKWDNLPNNIPERYIEKVLFNDGKIAFVNDKTMGLIALKCNQYESLNLYNEPIAWLCYSDNGYYKNYKSVDIDIVRNNKYSYPTRYLIDHHLHRLFNIESTIDKNLWYQRNLAVIKSTEETRLTMANIVKQYDENSFIICGNKDLNLKDNIDKIDFNIPFIADKLEDIKDRKWNDLINMLGLNSANTQKKERLITDEANANNQMIQLNVEVMLAERQLAVDSINEKFNQDIKVSLRKGINENEEDDIDG